MPHGRPSLSALSFPPNLPNARNSDVRLLQKRTKTSSAKTLDSCLTAFDILTKAEPHKSTSKAMRKDFCLGLWNCRDFSLSKPSSPTQISQWPSKTKKKRGIRDSCRSWRRVGVRDQATSPAGVQKAWSKVGGMPRCLPSRC